MMYCRIQHSVQTMSAGSSVGDRYSVREEPGVGGGLCMAPPPPYKCAVQSLYGHLYFGTRPVFTTAYAPLDWAVGSKCYEVLLECLYPRYSIIISTGLCRIV